MRKGKACKVMTVVFLAVFVFTGCRAFRTWAKVDKLRQESAMKDIKIQELQAKNAQLKDEINFYKEQAIEAKERIKELQKRKGEFADISKEGWEVKAVREGIKITGESDVLFPSGKFKLLSKAKVNLKKIAEIIKRKYPDKDIQVIGHTDTDPIKKTSEFNRSNLELSAKRAYEVADYLMKGCGVSEKKLCVVGHSFNKPAGAKKAKNRRVAILIIMLPEK